MDHKDLQLHSCTHILLIEQVCNSVALKFNNVLYEEM